MGMHGCGAAPVWGSHTTFRRAALESIGGYKPGLAEDLHTSICLHAAGWRSVYVPTLHASGLVPSDLRAFTMQQRKWAHGVFGILLESFPRAGHISAGRSESRTWCAPPTTSSARSSCCTRCLAVARCCSAAIRRSPALPSICCARCRSRRDRRHARPRQRVVERAGRRVGFKWRGTPSPTRCGRSIRAPSSAPSCAFRCRILRRRSGAPRMRIPARHCPGRAHRITGDGMRRARRRAGRRDSRGHDVLSRLRHRDPGIRRRGAMRP
jgi:hypothetical protein